MDLSKYASDIYKKDGIWYSNQVSDISYPEDGNQKCLQIEKESSWFRHRNACILALLSKYHEDGVFYDIGGGNGYVAKAVQESNIETVLVEPGIDGAFNAKNRGIENILCATLENAVFNEKIIDTAGAFDVVEHIEDDLAFIKDVGRYTKQGGYFFITVPAFQFLWSKTDERAGHFRRYTKKTLSKVLHEAGYEVSFISYMFSFLVVPIFIFRSIRSKLGLYKNELKTKKKEHSFSRGKSIIEKIMKFELNRFNSLKGVPFGSSLIVVAKKN